MPTRVRPLLAFAAVVAILGLTAWWMGRSAGDASAPEDLTLAVPEAAAQGGAERAGAASAQSPLGAERREATMPAVPASARDADAGPVFPASRPAGTLRGTTVDLAGASLAAVTVRVTAHAGRCPPGQTLADDRGVHRVARSDARGEFTFVTLPAGPYLVTAATEDGRAAWAEIALHAGDWPEPLRLVLRPPAPEDGFAVVVIDAQEQPVADAQVQVVGGVDGLGVVGQGALPPLSGTSDAAGRCVFADRHLTGAVVTATAADGRTGRAVLYPRQAVAQAMAQGGVRVRVDAPAQLLGTVAGIPAGQAEGVRVLARAMNTDRPWSVLTYGVTAAAPVQAGAFAFAGLPAGSYTLALESRHGLRLILPREAAGADPVLNSVALPRATLLPGQTTRCDLVAAPGGSLRGTVVTASGQPVAGAQVRTFFGPRGLSFVATQARDGVRILPMNFDTRPLAGHPDTHLSARTDADGSYRLDGLQPGAHCVEVTAAGRSSDCVLEAQVQDGQTTTLRHVLEAAGVLQGVTRPGSELTVLRQRETRPRAIAMVAQDSGLFTLPGLPAGSYDLLEGGVALATGVEIAAGRTTWIDLVTGGRFLLTGVVRDEFGPVAGALVRALGNMQRTGGDGRFALHLGMSPYQGVRTQVDVDGLHFVFPLPGLQPPLTATEVEARLGGNRLTVELADPDGRPLAHTVSIRSVGLLPGTAGVLEPSPLLTGGDGQRVLERLWPGSYELHARFGDGSDVRRVVTLPAQERVQLRAPATGALRVTVLDANGRPLPRQRVVALPWDGTGPLPGSEPLVEAERAAAAQRMRRGPTNPGPRTAPRPNRDGAPREGATAEARFQAVTDGEGRAELRPLPVGDYVLHLVASRDGPPARVAPERARVWRDQTTEVLLRASLGPR